MNMLTSVPDDFERWPAEQREAWQLAELRNVVRYAQEHSPFYRSLWDAHGILPDKMADFGDFQSYPIVTKSDMLRGAAPAAPIATARVGFSTRGTSGNPLVVWLDEKEAQRYVVPTARGFRWAGLREGDRALILSPSWHRLAAMEGHAVVGLHAQPNYFWGTLSDPTHVAPFIDALVEVRPQFVTSTPPFILSVLRHCDEEGLDPAEIFSSVRSVTLAGLALTPGLRKYLTARLDVEHVFERGGTQEGAALDECEFHTGMHIHEDVCYLEVVDSDGRVVAPGETGRLVITKLVPGGSPFVRYDTGDTAYFHSGPCECGRHLRRLRILGRPESTLTIQGRAITAYEVRCILDELPELVGRMSLLVNDASAPDRLRILMEGEPTGSDTEKELATRLHIDDVMIEWVGGAGLTWGFRQVIDVSELARRWQK